MKALHIHLYKSLSYRLLSICITFIISYLLTGNLTIAGSIASIDARYKIHCVLSYMKGHGVKFSDV